MSQAKFNLGEVVLHKQQGYRALVVDIDPVFQASGRYNPQTTTRTFAHQHPWYRLLVDDSSQLTYVEEPNLIRDPKPLSKAFENPRILEYLKKYNNTYLPNKPFH
ncbi:MAG: heat shock protein HspQ [Legionellaceae bacterium]|nr:heat shock protein HspQ [Legionellaceae bacterium]